MKNVKTVLIIDDDEDDVLLIRDRLSALTKNRCEFAVCVKKDQAIELLRQRTFDLCILDHRLAGYEGIDVLEAVYGDELATPIIMLTGQDDEEVAKQAIARGAQDFIMKSSIDEDIFEKSIRYAISRKELEFAKLLGKQNEAENVAKDKFIAHLSHELRTPLTSILGYTSLLLEDKSAQAHHKTLGIIANNGQHLLSLLNDVLDLSKIAAGKFELKYKKTNLERLFSEVQALISVSVLDKALYLNFSSPSALPKRILIDDVRLKQILVNVIGNAVKFTHSGGITVRISMKGAGQKPPHDEHKEADFSAYDALSIEIADTGIGMPPDQISRIFTPFKQIEDVTTRTAGGAGLGLSICSEIVKQMAGTLDVTSTPNSGTTFTLTLPCAYDPDSLGDFNFGIDTHRLVAKQAPQLQGKALIVDDLFEIRQLAGYFVKQTGVNVEYASHGEQAVEMVKTAAQSSEPYNLVLMDLHMPVMTGKKAMAELSKLQKIPPIVAMTASVNKGLQEELLLLGFTGLISKPLVKKELFKALTSALQKQVKNTDTATNVQTVHLIEDDADSAQVMKLIIESMGYQVVLSATALEAVDNAVSERSIDYHLLDLNLPDLQGQQLVEAFFHSKPSGKTYIVSGSEPDQSILQQFPIEDHLVKPINKDLLQSIFT